MSFAVLARNAVVIGCVAVAIRFVTIPVEPIPINVRWAAGTGADQRQALESQFGLIDGRVIDGSTWSYRLPDYSRGRIRAIVDHPAVADTHHIDRAAARPVDPPAGGAAAYARVGLAAGVGGALALALAGTRARVRLAHTALAAVAGAAPLMFVCAVALALSFTVVDVGALWPADDVTLVEAAYEADLATLHRMVAAGVDLEAAGTIDGQLMTPLEGAVRSGDARAVRVLLEGGAAPDAATRDRLIALAVETGADEVAAVLQRRAASVETGPQIP